jgi:hypothetical protein
VNSCYKAIKHVTGAASSKKLCHALKKCLDIIKSDYSDKTIFLEELKCALKQKAAICRLGIPAVAVAGECMPNVSIYDDSSAYLTYTAFKIGLCSSIKELDEQISGILDFFENDLSSPKSDGLRISEVMDMLGIVQKKYRLISAVTYGKDLEVYLMNKSHTCYDSFLLTFKNTYTGTWLNKWMVFALAPCHKITECNKYIVFLHELGHILYNAATSGGNRMPEMFGEIAFLLGMPQIENKIKPEELFADIFSGCAIHNTKYSDYNPFKKVLSEKYIELLEIYFKMLANRVDWESSRVVNTATLLH